MHWPNLPFAITRCLLCRAKTARQRLCTDCDRALNGLNLGPHCRRCALPLAQAGTDCGDCLKRPPAFDRVVAPYRYEFPLDELIARCKHGGCRGSQRWLAAALAHCVSTYYQRNAAPERVLAMPLHWRRRWQRGFNQTEALARTAARALDAELELRRLKRIRATHSQQGLSRKERLTNLKGAFHVHHDPGLKGAHLALVDDVVTTATTAQQAALALKRAGAARVDIWTLARTP